tara:strand:- start:1487 stop:5137 length:3651 start_codon:yes stop_codon:yes gene_type:complete
MKAIYMVLLAMVFLIPLVSAFEFDNVKSYDAEKKQITIKNSFLGIPTTEIAKVTLLSDLNHNVIDRGQGVYQKVAEFKIENIKEYNNALKNMEFFDVKRNLKPINRNYEYRYRVLKSTKNIPIHNETYCKGQIEDCRAPIIDYRTDYIYNWVTLDETRKENLPEGEIILGVFLDVKKREIGEWIPTLFGKRLSEWSTWSEGLNSGLTHYYTFNESSGSVAMDIGGFNLGNQINLSLSGTSAYFVNEGLIGNSAFIDTTASTNGRIRANGNIGISGTNDYAFSLWVNRSNPAVDGSFVFGSESAFPPYLSMYGSGGVGHMRLNWGGTDSGGINCGISQDGTKFDHVVLMESNGRVKLFVNNVLCINQTQGSLTINNLIIGNEQSLASETIAEWDEFGTWNRSLALAEISDLYNGGAGITYTNVFTTPPSITYPTNTTYSDQVTSMNYTQGGNAHCWYSLNSGTNSTPVTAGVNFTGLNSGGGSSTWRVYCNDSGNVITSDVVNFFVDVGVETFLKSPADALSTTDTTIEFEVNASASGSARLRNQTIYLYYSNSTLLTTNYSTISGLTSSRKFNYTFADGSYIWNAITEANSSSVFLNDWDTNRTFTVDSTAPIITITYPTTAIDFHKVNNNLRINWTVSDVTAGLDLCWIEYQSVNTTVTCNNNGTLINITNSGDKSAVFYANDTLGNQNSNSFNWSYKLFWNSETFNTTVYESQTQTYILNMSSTGDEAVTANFTFNGTNYTTTKEGTNIQMNFTFSHDLPIGVGTFNFSWNVFYGSDIINTTPQSQTVDLLNLSICGLGGLNTPFINFTAKDEVTDLPLDFTVDIADWTYYYLGAGDVSKTYGYVNVNANISSHAFCATPNLTIQQSLEVKYSDFIGDYPLRTYQTLEPISNTTTNTVLYLLKTTDGEDITLQVVSPAGVPIEGVYVNVTRTISGNLVLLGSGSTGADGGINFFLNPDFIHTFTFVKAGYDTLITSFQPKDSTVTLGAQVTGNQTYDFSRGISWAIKPLDFTLDNETHYIFNYSFANSGYWVVDEWGFVLTNNSGFVLGSNSSTATGGGNLNVNVTTGNNSYILMNYYWNIGGNYSNATKIWGVLDQTPKGTISGFVNLLKLYTSPCDINTSCEADETSLFGLTMWGRTLLIFFAIFILTGTLAYTTGIYSPTAIAAFASGWITLFDIGLGLLPLLPGSLSVHGVYSIISWMVVLMIGYREAMR